MPLTRDFKQTIVERARREPAFARALLDETASLFLNGDAAAVIDQALQLKASERAAVAEQILLSLDVPNPDIDAAWAREADARVEAHERGEIESILAEDVFAKYKPE